MVIAQNMLCVLLCQEENTVITVFLKHLHFSTFK